MFWRLMAVALFCTGAVATTVAQRSSQNQINASGQILMLGMPRSKVFSLLSNNYHLIEDSKWSAENKPYSLWSVSAEIVAGGKTVMSQGKPLEELKGRIKFRGDKLEGVSWAWTPDSQESSDFALNIIKLLDHFSKEGSVHCIISTESQDTAQQEQRSAVIRCGLRSLFIGHDRFPGLTLPNGDGYPDSAASIFEQLNW